MGDVMTPPQALALYEDIRWRLNAEVEVHFRQNRTGSRLKRKLLNAGPLSFVIFIICFMHSIGEIDQNFLSIRCNRKWKENSPEQVSSFKYVPVILIILYKSIKICCFFLVSLIFSSKEMKLGRGSKLPILHPKPQKKKFLPLPTL